jgi:hypothetical protein
MIYEIRQNNDDYRDIFNYFLCKLGWNYYIRYDIRQTFYDYFYYDLSECVN